MRKEIVWGSVIKTVFAMCAVMVFFGPAGTLKVSAKDVNVKNYGAVADDKMDDTDAFNAAIATAGKTGGGTVRVPAGRYYISASPAINEGICMWSNVKLLMSPNTILQVRPNPYETYHVINVFGVTNVDIVGGQIRGERYRHQGTTGEYGMGIRVRDSKNVLIQNVTIKDNWGDGIYLGTMNDYDSLYGCSKVTIKGCTISNNRRNNITIADANLVNIENCVIKNANGIAPQCGIDIEPNVQDGGFIQENQVCKSINIKNTKITCVKSGNTKGEYFALMIINNWFSIGKNKTVAENVKIDNCNLGGYVGNYSGKNVSMRKTNIKGTFIYLRNTKFKNCKVKKKERWNG